MIARALSLPRDIRLALVLVACAISCRENGRSLTETAQPLETFRRSSSSCSRSCRQPRPRRTNDLMEVL